MESKPSTSQEIDPETLIDASSSVDEEDEGVAEQDNTWDDWESGEDEPDSDLICLFCDSKFQSSETLFGHCRADHSFDFSSVRRNLGLDFYGCVKLINFIRTKTADNKCWSCGMGFEYSEDLRNHLHALLGLENCSGFAWEDDVYLRPFLGDDALLCCFDEDGECDIEDDGCAMSVDREELMKELEKDANFAGFVANGDRVDFEASSCGAHNEDKLGCSSGNGVIQMYVSSERNNVDPISVEAVQEGPRLEVKEEKHLKVSFAKVAEKEKKKANESYFGSYGSFGIHREMLSDKARMDAYSGALLNNPSLIRGMTVMDVGCGTGILSLFAAKAGAASVIAVEASEKMAGMAKQIIKDNKLLHEENEIADCRDHGVIKVVCGMVEDLDKLVQIPQHSIDVLVSEWMGYCLLFETMLDSVLYARDHWLKPGGAILPDTATIFAAGFGRGGTSVPFWENVYGFDMSSVGKEVLDAAAQSPIVDVVDVKDIVTETAVLQRFDLATVKHDEVDFTSSVELELKPEVPNDSICEGNGITWCYGVVLWFETGFTGRFCREKPVVLSTSPYSQKTHWSQTIFTFSEPVALSRLPLPSSANNSKGSITIGCEENPAIKIDARISIVRASFHRSIDISLELTAISADGRKHSFPIQIFDL